jgi:hypothetical protein
MYMPSKNMTHGRSHVVMSNSDLPSLLKTSSTLVMLASNSATPALLVIRT